jgi:nicotinate-nucleotide adenylyltransferase
MCAKQRIALYGGTFDPIHLGHLDVARRVAELFEIERILFVPAQIAPHKIARPVTAPIHRYAMLALATQNDERLKISTFELDAADRRYTVDTVEHFQQSFGSSVQLFFIMGADSWSEITTWRQWERLLTMSNHIVVTRPGYDIEDIPVAIRDRIVDLRSVMSVERELARSVNQPRIYLTDVVNTDVSATSIRRVASQGRIDELKTLVTEPVAEYIKKYGIYKDSHEAKLNS